MCCGCGVGWVGVGGKGFAHIRRGFNEQSGCDTARPLAVCVRPLPRVISLARALVLRCLRFWSGWGRAGGPEQHGCGCGCSDNRHTSEVNWGGEGSEVGGCG